MSQSPGATQGDMIENLTFDELDIGRTAQLVRTVTQDDIRAFAAVSGDLNPVHLNAAYAETTLFKGVIAHGMLGGALFSTLLGTQMPGPGTIYVEQSLRFARPVHIGDTLTATITVRAKDDARKRVEFDCVLTNQKGEKVTSGVAKVLAPTEKLRLPRSQAPRLQLV